MAHRPLNLLYITYRVDPADTLVGYVVGWLRLLAAHADSLHVICLHAAPALDLPANVHVHSLEKGRGGRWAVWGRFFRTVWSLRRAVNLVFAQFSPEYLLAAAPFALLFRWPLTLWYTHRHVDLKLRLATALAARVFTASPESFRLPTPKRVILGHGIDTARFTPAHSLPTAPLLLAVGRRAPIKHYELLIDAIAALAPRYPDLRLRIVGGDEGSAPPNYAASLQARIDAHGLGEIITLVGPRPYADLPADYRAASLHLNFCPTGGLDKAVLEAMSAGLPNLVRNTGFAPIFAADAALCLAPDADLATLTAALDRLLQLPPADRAALGQRARHTAVAQFSQTALVERLAAELTALLPRA